MPTDQRRGSRVLASPACSARATEPVACQRSRSVRRRGRARKRGLVMATVEPITFGALLRRHRKAAGLTQEELAERAGLSPNNISVLERGLSQAPRKDTVALLAEALQLSDTERARFEESARGRFPPQARREEGIVGLPSATARHPGAEWLPPFVGRSAEMQALACHLTGSGAPLLVVVGEPGIGKSRLLHEAARSGRSGGWTVLADGCH